MIKRERESKVVKKQRRKEGKFEKKKA